MPERRVFEREATRIPFIYRVGGNGQRQDGEWREAETVDIGPVLVGGLAFYAEAPLEIGSEIRFALFMDLDLKRAWENDQESFPPIYHGSVVRATPDQQGYRIAVAFKDEQA